nr:PREDICTED: uncharacterized protein LOC108197159 isoform X1 [Daucus carota subsp. sativus]XP_017220174.1 PREDICTED: uncharacterized protein LOC108197159 isoform X1 [Daucus carota subsp. sativus]XP_017220175.1 PREDICTED: uncharacterized protein LOC108197159 isoform X1 [Daucus carota subsp. sativus]XP_017220176.1 PREDICTED: uncharacterized protein LOC108197159 isoform X1 [Daucus carota subsp. sativus]
MIKRELRLSMNNGLTELFCYFLEIFYLSAKMEPKKVIAICQSRDNFELGEDGLMSFNGGEAYAVDLDQQTQLSEFKQEIAETFKYSDEDMSIKYFLPGNRKTLITILKDRDLQRMVNFYGNCQMQIGWLSMAYLCIKISHHPVNMHQENELNAHM